MKLMNLFEHWIGKNQTKETRDTLVNTLSMMITHDGTSLLENPEWSSPTIQFIESMSNGRKRVITPSGKIDAKLAGTYRHFGIFPIRLTIENRSFEDWNLPGYNPLTLRYRLNGPNGEVKIKASPHKRILDPLPKRQRREFDVTFDVDPDIAKPGDIMTITLYQHGTGWFDQHGMKPAQITLPI